MPANFIPVSGGGLTISNTVSYKTSTDDAVRQVKNALPRADHLRRKPWRGAPNRLAGHCYIACEAVKELSTDDLRPFWVKHGGTTHWFLRTPWGEVIDPTAGQFTTPPPYDAGRGCGFLTKGPSRRARALMEIIEDRRTAFFNNSTFTMSATFATTSPTSFAAITGLGY